MTEPLLAGLELSFSYDKAPFLEGASFSLCPGEIVAILGPNGAGKTTLLRLAAGLLTPSLGSVRLGGRDLREIPRREIARNLALVPSEGAAAEGFTSREVVAMGRYPHLAPFSAPGSADRAAIERALDRVGVRPLAERSFSLLSSGERRRVLLARALAQEAPALLLDEPTVHLDLGHQVEIHRLLVSLVREEGRGVLMISHDLPLAAQVADRMILLDRGRILATGTPVQVCEPSLLSRVFGTDLERIPHPRTGAALLLPRL